MSAVTVYDEWHPEEVHQEVRCRGAAAGEKVVRSGAGGGAVAALHTLYFAV